MSVSFVTFGHIRKNEMGEFVGPLVWEVWDPVESDLKDSQCAFPLCGSWERTLNLLRLTLVIPVFIPELQFCKFGSPSCASGDLAALFCSSEYLSKYFTVLPTVAPLTMQMLVQLWLAVMPWLAAYWSQALKYPSAFDCLQDVLPLNWGTVSHFQFWTVLLLL